MGRVEVEAIGEGGEIGAGGEIDTDSIELRENVVWVELELILVMKS